MPSRQRALGLAWLCALGVRGDPRRAADRQRLDAYWYSPRVRYWVRLENHLSGYTEELVEFTPLAP